MCQYASFVGVIGNDTSIVVVRKKCFCKEASYNDRGEEFNRIDYDSSYSVMSK